MVARRQSGKRPTNSQPSTRRFHQRRGFFLIMTLIVVAMATMAAYSFSDLMIAYDETAYLKNDEAQAQLMVESASEALRVILAQPPATRDESGGVFNNPALFQAISVVPGADANSRGNYTVLTTAIDETGQLAGLRYGLTNESARLNINVLPTLETSGAALTAVTATLAAEGDDGSTDPANLARSLLLGLPNMTEDVADCILDFLDEDDEPRDYGAESEYYLGLPNPYNAKNGPLDSVEELLLVKGVTPYMLFGADANRNGVIDAAEQQNAMMAGGSTMALGWSAYFTVYSLENNKRADGTPRVNVNSDDLEVLFADLSEALGNDDWASFIVAYRIAGQASGGGLTGAVLGAGSSGSGSSGGGSGGSSGSGSGGGASSGGSSGGASGGSQATELWTADKLEAMDLSGGGGTQVTQLLDLIGATVEVDGTSYMSPFMDGPLAMAVYMPSLMANLTTQDFTTMPGRININECPAELIRGIPMLDPEIAEEIIQARGESTDSENRKYETWPLVEGLITLDEMRLLMPLVTAGGDVYRAQVVGYFEGRNSSYRAEMVIDATSVNPKVIYWRDLSHLGRGFDKAVLGVRAADAFQSTLESAGN